MNLKTIIMRFNDLSTAEQIKIKGKFKLPLNTSEVEVDTFKRPFERVSGAIVMLPLKPSGVYGSFHKHELKNRV